MPSTYTPSLKLELIANGDQVNTWGNTTNNNLGTLIEQAITGVQPITLTGDTTLTSYNGLSDQARNAVLVFNGSLSNAANVTIPSEPKTYIVSNRSGANVTIKTSNGNGFTLSNNVNSFLYCDATEVYAAIDTSNISGDLSVSGDQTVGGSITIGEDITLSNTIASDSGTLSLSGSTGIVDMAVNSGAFTPPYGATSDRPGSPDLGMTRWNSTGGYLEIWSGVQWQNITGNYAVDYLIVAGGGAGRAGGGGAGGLLANTTTVAVGTAYTITVGSGGSGSNGSNSSAFSLTAIGGGKGNLGADGSSGGSGGGGANGEPAKSGGSGTSGQGYAGGNGFGVNISGAGDGGGGGAGAIGQNGQNTTGGNGGAGVASSINGSSAYYAGGGGGGSDNIGGSGGSGGGGRGSGNASGAPTAGTTNTGGGGGGGSGAAGGSGIVIIRYASASQRGTGGTVTSYSDAGTTYFVHTFTTSGTFTA